MCETSALPSMPVLSEFYHKFFNTESVIPFYPQPDLTTSTPDDYDSWVNDLQGG